MTYKELKELLLQASHEYYVNNHSIMSDYDFDIKMHELEAMEEAQGYADDDSPTKRPGSDKSSDSSTENTHGRPMLSLENTYDINDVTKWYNDMVKATGNPKLEVIVNPKWDGGSCAIRMKHGIVTKALTRGDGTVGEDITANTSLCLKEVSAGLTNTLGQYIDDLGVSHPFSGEARGEIIMSTKGFNILNADNRYQNARNLVCGSMKLLDIEEFRPRAIYIWFMAYWLENSKNKTYSEDLDELQKYFFVGPYYKCTSIEEIMKAIENIEHADYGVAIDGAVMKINDKTQWDKIGSTAHHPRWAKAYKYHQEESETKVISVEFQVGRTGKVTPVANLEPVFIDGSTISRVTLNNEDYISNLDLSIGDNVIVHKAAAIIPEIVRVSKKNGGIKVRFPTVCPDCGKPIVRDFDKSDYFCKNPNCKSKVIAYLDYFCHTMEIDGLSIATLTQLYERLEIDNIGKLYDTFTDSNKILVCRTLDKFKVKSFDHIADELNKTLNGKANQAKVLAAIGIPGVGTKVAKVLLKRFGSVYKVLYETTKTDLLSVEGIGDVMAEDISNYKYGTLYEPDNNTKELIQGNDTYMLALGIFSKENTESPKNMSNVESKKVCITGALSRPRKEIEEMIFNKGWEVMSGVTSKTDYLVTNEENPSSTKAKKAIELGVEIITENKLNEILNNLK